ncbi:hypothetical protein HDU76_003313 [Blyttiomyces sp. JEL0837]|nr:hypothetical protein HDU76_003313 [Blyttiomyces sp. JEL0837]
MTELNPSASHYTNERVKIYGPPAKSSWPGNGGDSGHSSRLPSVGGATGRVDAVPTMGEGQQQQSLPTATHLEGFLPKVHVNAAGTYEHTRRLISASHVNMVLNQLEKLRASMREKDLDILKLRHENIVLKQIERRQQKDIDQMDSQNQDAPRLIRGLRDEITGLKAKLRKYFNQLTNDGRRIRTLNEECRKLRDHVSHLETLAQSQELLDRESLSKQILESSKQLIELEKTASEATRKSKLVEKILSGENRQLRGKIHNLETENSFLKDKNQRLDDIIKEKDREIASLSIYRFNAVHRKAEQSVCKRCQKREKEETESRRKQAILGINKLL